MCIHICEHRFFLGYLSSFACNQNCDRYCLTVYMDIIQFMIAPVPDNCTVLTVAHKIMSCLPVKGVSLLIVTVTGHFLFLIFLKNQSCMWSAAMQIQYVQYLIKSSEFVCFSNSIACYKIFGTEFVFFALHICMWTLFFRIMNSIFLQ